MTPHRGMTGPSRMRAAQKLIACPAWASAPHICGTAGTQPEREAPRYHPMSERSEPLDAAPGRSDGWLLGQLDLYVYACCEIELHQRVDRLRRGLHDVEQPLVRPHLELLARLLVDVRRAVDGELLDARREGNGSADESTGAARRVGDVASRLVEHSMIESLQANPDVLRFHVPTDAKEPANHSSKPRPA